MSSAGYPKPVDAVYILGEIQAGFVDCRSMLLKVVRDRASFRSIITGNRSKLSDGSKELDDTLSSIIDKLSDLSGEEDIPIDSSDKIRELRRIEKTLRDKVLEELLDLRTDETLVVDYDRLSRNATSLYDEAVGVFRG